MLSVKPLKKWKENEFPSSRSLAFRKQVWKDAGGYPEYTLTAEDTFFNRMITRKGYKFYTQRSAIVYWKMRESLKDFAKQYYKYGEGDGFMRIFLLKKKILE